MKNQIMSTQRYEQVLDLLEKDKNAFKKLSPSEKREISRDGYAMSLAAAKDVNNLKYVSRKLRQDKAFMVGCIHENPLAMTYCYKTWFQNKQFVGFLREIAIAEGEKYNSAEIKFLYDQLIDRHIQQSKTIASER